MNVSDYRTHFWIIFSSIIWQYVAFFAHAEGPPFVARTGSTLSLPDVNGGLSPKMGHFIYSIGDLSENNCISEDVRKLSDIPTQFADLRKKMKSLSFTSASGNFVESACWVFIRIDGFSKSECIQGTSSLNVNVELINQTLRKLYRKFSGDFAFVVFAHTHPTPDIYLKETGTITNHLGPSVPDLQFHQYVESQLKDVHGMPLGSFISLVFPVDSNDQIDFFYTAISFQDSSGSCPKNPNE